MIPYIIVYNNEINYYCSINKNIIKNNIITFLYNIIELYELPNTINDDIFKWNYNIFINNEWKQPWNLDNLYTSAYNLIKNDYIEYL